MTRWIVSYVMPNGSKGTWPVSASNRDEAIDRAKQEHRTEMNRGAQITGVSPA